MKWLKILFILGCSGMAQTACSQDTLFWSPGYKLAWMDFKGKPGPASRHLATTFSGIAYTYRLSNKAITYKVVAFFDRNKSWKKPAVTDEILRHEQGHFDITQIFARKLEKEFANLAAPHKITGKQLEVIAEKIIKDKNACQQLYDTETGFGRKLMEQQRWEKLIASQLTSR